MTKEELILKIYSLMEINNRKQILHQQKDKSAGVLTREAVELVKLLPLIQQYNLTPCISFKHQNDLIKLNPPVHTSHTNI